MGKSLTEFLRENRSYIVHTEEVLTVDWSPTYGASDPSPRTIELVDFDALMNAIDEFTETFKKEKA